MSPLFTTVVITGAVISVSLAIIIIRHILRENGVKRLLANFQDVANEFGFFISNQQLPGRSVIALDNISKRLLYLSRSSGKSEGYLVHLAEIKSVSVKRVYGVIPSYNKYWSNMAPIVGKIDLEIEFKLKSEPLFLPFYEKTIDPVSEMRARAAMAKEWQILISEKLTNDEQPARNVIRTFDAPKLSLEMIMS